MKLWSLMLRVSVLLLVFQSATCRRNRPQQTRQQVTNRIRRSGQNCNISSPNGMWTIASMGSGAQLVLYRVNGSRARRIVGISPTAVSEQYPNGTWVRRASRFTGNNLNVQWDCSVANFTNIDANGTATTVLGASASMSTMATVTNRADNTSFNVSASMTASVLEAETQTTICKPNDPSNCTVVTLPIGLKFSLEFSGWQFSAVDNNLVFGVQLRFPNMIRSTIRQTDQGGSTVGSGANRRRVVGRRRIALAQGVLDNPAEAAYSCAGGASGFVAVTTTGARDSQMNSAVNIRYSLASGVPSGCTINYDPVAGDANSTTSGSASTTTTTPAPTSGVRGHERVVTFIALLVQIFWVVVVF